jgi:tetratricopeptide (TPR) repeat protein
VARRPFALFARCRFHDVVVDEQMVYAGKALELGSSNPAESDAEEKSARPWLVRALWTSPRHVAVQDSSGAVHHLEPGKDLTIDFGPLAVDLYLAERIPVRRAEPWSLRGSLAWLAVVVMTTVLTQQAMWLGENQCELAFNLLPGVGDLGAPVLLVVAPLAALVVALFVLVTSENTRKVLPVLGLPLLALSLPLGYRLLGLQWMGTGADALAQEFAYCVPPPPEPGGGHPMSAEYLARLLRNDLEGEDQGVIAEQVERPRAEKKVENNDLYMPAGGKGPVTRMGGAEETAPNPVRTMSQEDQVALPAEPEAEVKLAVENGPEISRPNPEDPLPVEPTEDKEGSQAAAEEHEGWGFPAWYDEEDERMDNFEIEMMLRAAKSRLRIDPNDAAALSILSYYQYLAQDYDAAKKTYDKFIELFPEDAAGYNNKALIYKRLGEYQKEESLYRVALGLSPNDVTALNNLGVNLAHQKRFEEALEVMRQLEVLDPGDPYAELHRAKIHAEMGNDEEALRYLDKALSGMEKLDTLHHIEFRQDIRLDPSFEKLRNSYRFRAILDQYYGKDSPLQE